MDPTRNFRGSVESDQNHVTISIDGHESTPIKVQGYIKEKLRWANLFTYFLGSIRSNKEFIQIKVNDQTVLVKVTDLAQKLCMSESQLRGSNQLTQDVEDRLSFLEAQKEKIIQQTNNRVVSEIGEESLEPGVVDTMALIVFKAHFILNENSGNRSTVHQEIPISKTLRILAEDSPEGIRITTLFGEKVGAGKYGVAVRTFNLLGSECGRKIAKLSLKNESAKEQLQNEAKVIKILNPYGKACGLQKPLFLGQGFHLGVEYDASLLDAINHPVDYGLTYDAMVSIAYQLMEGLTTIHEKGYSHADIKPENIFYNKPQGIEGPRVYIGDFGGALSLEIAFEEDLPRIRSPNYSVLWDLIKLASAKNDKNFEVYKEIEQKSDVFAMCSTIAAMVIRKLPYDVCPGKNLEYNVDKNLVFNLQREGGFDERSAKLIQSNLSKGYQDRSMANIVRDAFKEAIWKSAIGVSDYRQLPIMEDVDLENDLKDSDINTYRFTQGDNGSIKVTVKRKNGLVHEVIDYQHPYEVRERINSFFRKLMSHP